MGKIHATPSGTSSLLRDGRSFRCFLPPENYVGVRWRKGVGHAIDVLRKHPADRHCSETADRKNLPLMVVGFFKGISLG
jgi:hypothetical protein